LILVKPRPPARREDARMKNPDPASIDAVWEHRRVMVEADPRTGARTPAEKFVFPPRHRDLSRRFSGRAGS
jgi:hypothetical protein